jgi:hypothetical protein
MVRCSYLMLLIMNMDVLGCSLNLAFALSSTTVHLESSNVVQSSHACSSAKSMGTELGFSLCGDVSPIMQLDG